MEIKIHQIFYKEEQRPHLDPAFIPYDNSGSRPPHNFEYSVFVTNFMQGRIQEALTGFVSWKFNQKTGVTGKDFMGFIESHPGYDVYFINPFPDQSCFRNVWEQGDHFHPRLTEITRELLTKAGYRIDLKSFDNRMDSLCYCNYWVGTPEFWRKYMDFIRPLYKYITEKATSEELEILNVKADKLIEAPYPPFIFERMFSTFLALNPGIRRCPYEYDSSQLKKKYPKISGLLESMRDASRDRKTILYHFNRRLLYFRLYGIRKIPWLMQLRRLRN